MEVLWWDSKWIPIMEVCPQEQNADISVSGLIHCCTEYSLATSLPLINPYNALVRMSMAVCAMFPTGQKICIALEDGGQSPSVVILTQGIHHVTPYSLSFHDQNAQK